MTATSSRDYGQEPHRKDTKRERKKAAVQDVEAKDWDTIHGDGSSLGLDERRTESSERD